MKLVKDIVLPYLWPISLEKVEKSLHPIEKGDRSPDDDDDKNDNDENDNDDNDNDDTDDCTVSHCVALLRSGQPTTNLSKRYHYTVVNSVNLITTTGNSVSVFHSIFCRLKSSVSSLTNSFIFWLQYLFMCA